jgi:hypothetical protein
MIPFHSFRLFQLLRVTLVLFLCAVPGFSAETSDEHYILRNLDFDVCDPVRFQAKIAEANSARGSLTVAEKEIRLMDVKTDGNRLATVLLDLEGKAVQITEFKTGDLVLVEGFAHPKGFVAASKIQKIPAVTGPPKTKHDLVRRANAKHKHSNPHN